GRVPRRVERDEDDPGPTLDLPRHPPQDLGEVREVDRADVGAVRVPEEQERQVAFRLGEEVERPTLLVQQREVGLRDRLFENDAAEPALRRRAGRREFAGIARAAPGYAREHEGDEDADREGTPRG